MSSSHAASQDAITSRNDPSLFEGILPKRGRLVALRTKAECRVRIDTIEVYTAEIPLKLSSHHLNVLKKGISDFDGVSLQHLRRFVKPDLLPSHLSPTQADLPESVDALESTELSDPDGRPHNAPTETPKPATNHLLICPTSLISITDLTALLSTHPAPSPAPSPPPIRIFPVPLRPPTSRAQAARWTADLWPTLYNPSHPFGPNPTILRRAEAELAPRAGSWLALTERAGELCARQGVGEAVGCVVVERRDAGDVALAVAGDARWRCGGAEEEREGGGNVMAHAAMRAIGMVARKRVQADKTGGVHTSSSTSASAPPRTAVEDGRGPNVFADEPLNELEARVFNHADVTPNGYLCVDLDVYLSHEPCVMCAMALLHSRFGRCVFARRMPRTGGLTADSELESSEAGTQTSSDGDDEEEKRRPPGLGYGLFWRPELNWKFLAWEWRNDREDGIANVAEELHA